MGLVHRPVFIDFYSIDVVDFRRGGEMHDSDFEGMCRSLVLEFEVSWCGCICLEANHGGAEEGGSKKC
jgi:hypothetical protein